MATIYKKNGWYYVNYRDHTGRQVKRKTAQSHEKAQYILKQLVAQVAEKKLLGHTVTQAKRLTFRAAAEQYIEQRRGIKEPATIRMDLLAMKSLLPVFGGDYLEHLSQQAYDRYVVDRVRSAGVPMANREIAVLSAFLNHAVKWKLIACLPIRCVKLKEHPGRIRYLSDEERAVLWPQLAPHITDFCSIALNTGMRKGEIRALARPDIDLRNEIIHVERTKTHERRDIPMTPEAKEILQRLLAKGGHKVFPGVGDFKKAWLSALRRAHVENFRFHDLRHTFASYLVMNGEHLITVKELLGHKSIEMTMRYAHLAPDMKRAAIHRLSDRLQKNLHSEAISAPVGTKWESTLFKPPGDGEGREV